MPVSVVVGGQFGSEGKGKVALDIARRQRAAAVVRTGGTNSGHTGVRDDGGTCALRQLPVAALAPETLVILPPGSLVDVDLFLTEVALLGLSPDRVKLDPMATVITKNDRLAEREGGLVESIGSTGSGTGAALQHRISRRNRECLVQTLDHPELRSFFCDTAPLMRKLLDRDELIVIEGTQGFGLSVFHGGFYPKATSRDTTAGTFVGEAGLSPRDVRDIVLVIRAFPIRVAGDSGPLPHETTWSEIAKSADLPPDFCELTTATKKVRRVAKFDPEIVRKAIAVNNPSEIVLNHFDYVDPCVRTGRFSDRAIAFLESTEARIGRQISWLGTGPGTLAQRDSLRNVAA